MTARRISGGGWPVSWIKRVIEAIRKAAVPAGGRASPEDHVRKTPPRCLGALNVTPTADVLVDGEGTTTFWQLACKCGGDRGELLGYPLSHFVPEDASKDLVTPIAFGCVRCGVVTEILDTDQHGYHVEVGRLEGSPGGTKWRGGGVRQKHSCPSCESSVFAFRSGFVYWDFDIVEDEPELQAEQFFHEFRLSCTCSACGTTSEPVNLGKL